MQKTIKFIKINSDEFTSNWLSVRQNSNAKPIYKIVSRFSHLTEGAIVLLHKAGSNYLIRYAVKELIEIKNILFEMDIKEVKLLYWILENGNPYQNNDN